MINWNISPWFIQLSLLFILIDAYRWTCNNKHFLQLNWFRQFSWYFDTIPIKWLNNVFANGKLATAAWLLWVWMDLRHEQKQNGNIGQANTHSRVSEWVGWSALFWKSKANFTHEFTNSIFLIFVQQQYDFAVYVSTWRTKIHYYSCSYVVIKCVDVDVAVIFDSTSSMMCTGGTDYPEAVVLITLLCNFQQQKVVMEWISTHSRCRSLTHVFFLRTFYFDFKILCWWKTAQKIARKQRCTQNF